MNNFEKRVMELANKGYTESTIASKLGVYDTTVVKVLERYGYYG